MNFKSIVVQNLLYCQRCVVSHYEATLFGVNNDIRQVEFWSAGKINECV